jgi:hypothetical protein
MAAGDIKLVYGSSSNLTVTNLNSLASSSGRLAGWTSGTIDNTTDLHLDKLISGKFTTASANRQAGVIEVWAYAMLDDSTWPDVFSAGTEGTEGAATIHDDEQKAECFELLWSTTVDTTNGDVHNMKPRSVRAAFGFMPAKFALFVTTTAANSTNAGFASSGNQITSKGYYENVASA